MADLDAIFKAYDVRGTVGDQIDADTCRAIGGAFARFAREAEGATRVRLERMSESLQADPSALKTLAAAGLRPGVECDARATATGVELLCEGRELAISHADAALLFVAVLDGE